jgi:hypothetical protein
MRRLIIIHSDMIPPAPPFVNSALMNTARNAAHGQTQRSRFPVLRPACRPAQRSGMSGIPGQRAFLPRHAHSITYRRAPHIGMEIAAHGRTQGLFAMPRATCTGFSQTFSKHFKTCA